MITSQICLIVTLHWEQSCSNKIHYSFTCILSLIKAIKISCFTGMYEIFHCVSKLKFLQHVYMLSLIFFTIFFFYSRIICYFRGPSKSTLISNQDIYHYSLKKYFIFYKVLHSSTNLCLGTIICARINIFVLIVR